MSPHVGSHASTISTERCAPFVPFSCKKEYFFRENYLGWRYMFLDEVAVNERVERFPQSVAGVILRLHRTLGDAKHSL